MLAVHHNRCFICHQNTMKGPLECHHIIPRSKSKYILKWDWRNGIAVHTGECHSFAASEKGKQQIAQKHPWYSYLVDMERITKKDYLTAFEMSDNEFREWTLGELKEIVAAEIYEM